MSNKKNTDISKIISRIKKNITFIIVILIIIYSALFIFTINNRNNPEIENMINIIFIVPSFAIIGWIIKIVIDTLKKKPGSSLILKLTLYFLFITAIPFLMLIINSVNLVEEIYQTYISLEKIDNTVSNVTRLIKEQTEKELKKDMDITIEAFYEEIAKRKDGIINLSNEIDINNTDYIIIFRLERDEVNKEFNSARIISYFTKRRTFFMTIYQEINNAVLNEMLYDIYFFEKVIYNNVKYNNNPITNYYKLKDTDYISFYLQYIKNVPERMDDNEINTYNNNIDYFAIGISYVSELELKITEEFSELSGLIAERSITKNETLAQLTEYILFISLPIFLVAILLSFILAIRFTRPMELLIRGTKGVAAGDLKYRIITKRQDELGLLIDAFNKMAEELEKNKFSLFKAQKAAAWREVARKLAHEIKNPLTPIKLSSERIKRQFHKKNPNIENIIDVCSNTIIEEVDRLSHIIQEFSDFAKTPEAKKEKNNIREILENIVKSYTEIRPNINFIFKNYLKEEQQILFLDKNQFKQTMINLIENSIEVIPEKKGKIEIILRKQEEKNNKQPYNMSYCIIEVTDNGKGMSKEVQKKIFNPYFTTKDNGTGLGLVIIKNIIEDHQGTIRFISEENKGTSFYIKLPMLNGEN